MFSPTASYYDAIYAARGKNYEQEVQRLLNLIQQYKRSPGNTLLDVACGTGEHLVYLQHAFQLEGLDLDPELLKVAHQKIPAATFHLADMVDFDLERQFDVVTCLFSSIGYVKTCDRLDSAIQAMHRHTRPGGVLIVEPWLGPEEYHTGSVHATYVDQPTLKVARMNVSRIIEGNVSVLDFHYLIATADGVQHFTEHHELGLFVQEEYHSAFEHCGMLVVYDETGLEGRGLYVGIKPSL